MNRFIRSTLAAVALSATSFAVFTETPAASNKVESAIAAQLQRYEKALNASDVEGVMELYAQDAVFMPPHSSSHVGREAVRAAYRRVFDTIKLSTHFEVAEIRQLSQDWAYARTNSSGTVKLSASDQPPSPETYQELFLLHREADGQWRFARYIFSTTTPPQQQ